MIQLKLLKNRKKNQQGQTLIEYALSILVVLGMFFVINNSVLRGIGKLWLTLAKEIAAPCPKCAPPEALNWRLCVTNLNWFQIENCL